MEILNLNILNENKQTKYEMESILNILNNCDLLKGSKHNSIDYIKSKLDDATKLI